jgi:hypothetical protein
MEVESALMAHRMVAEAAVIARLDDLKGRVLDVGVEGGIAFLGCEGDRVIGEAERYPIHGSSR